jgi:hypothetical protein
MAMAHSLAARDRDGTKILARLARFSMLIGLVGQKVDRGGLSWMFEVRNGSRRSICRRWLGGWV